MKRRNYNQVRGLILTNEKFINFCNEHSLSISKLEKLDIESLPDMYAFIRPSDAKCNDDVFLENDLATQPKVVLAVKVNDSGICGFQTTKYTNEVRK